MIDIDKLIERNNAAFKKKEEELDLEEAPF